MLYFANNPLNSDEKIMLAVRLPKELENQLDFLASKTHRSKSYYVKKALEEFFKNKAEYEFAAEAYREFLESGKKAHSYESVMRENGLEP